MKKAFLLLLWFSPHLAVSEGAAVVDELRQENEDLKASLLQSKASLLQSRASERRLRQEKEDLKGEVEYLRARRCLDTPSATDSAAAARSNADSCTAMLAVCTAALPSTAVLAIHSIFPISPPAAAPSEEEACPVCLCPEPPPPCEDCEDCEEPPPCPRCTSEPTPVPIPDPTAQPTLATCPFIDVKASTTTAGASCAGGAAADGPTCAFECASGYYLAAGASSTITCSADGESWREGRARLVGDTPRGSACRGSLTAADKAFALNHTFPVPPSLSFGVARGLARVPDVRTGGPCGPGVRGQLRVHGRP